MFAAAPAFAHNGGAGGPVIQVPRPPAGDGATAFDIVKDVEAKASDPKTKKLVASSIEHAQGSLERAHGARAAGDAAHAHMLDGLALEWAESARDLLRAASAEHVAASAADKAREAAVRAERARALLEETQARRGRADAELEKALAQEREARERAAEAEDARLAAGKAAASTPARKSGSAPKPKKKGK
jgi:colicin import membrane protein